jgi:hypothetical protein
MDRYERMRSGDWPHDAGPSNFPRMQEGTHPQRRRVEWLEHAGRTVLALGVLALLAAFIR